MMKKILLLLTVLCSKLSYAQDPVLFEHEWFLHSLIIEGKETNHPMPQYEIILNFNGDNEDMDYLEVYIPICESGPAGAIDNFDEGNIFSLVSFEWVLVDVCPSDLVDFMEFINNHNYIYAIDDGSGIPKNPFIYTLETDGDNHTLTIENVDGDYAVYSDQQLSTNEFENIDFSVYPNPVSETLHILSNKNVTKTSVYSITGQQMTVFNDPVKKVDVSSLQNGLYFLVLETSKGKRQAVKFIKE